MLKNLSSKIAGCTISFVILSVFECHYAQAITLTFYQNSFPDNGFLKGEFNGEDKNNDGYIDIDIFSNYFYEEGYDSGNIVLEYFSDIIDSDVSRFYVDSTYASEFQFRYSILSNQLTGYLYYPNVGVDLNENRMGQNITCVYYYVDAGCSNSPLVVQNLSDNSSTKVPEPSLSLTLLAVGALSAGSALLRRQKQ
jgi:hypothetical protein